MIDNTAFHFFSKLSLLQHHLGCCNERKIADTTSILLFYKFISTKIETLKKECPEDVIFKEIAKLKLGYFIEDEYLLSSIINFQGTPKEIIDRLKEVFQKFVSNKDNLSDIFFILSYVIRG